MNTPQLLSILRKTGWSTIPPSSGVYCWYFPQSELAHLRIAELCDVAKLQLRLSPDGYVSLYHGCKSNLAKRVEWHAAQKLTLSCLQSGILSTFRFTLLALNDFDYLKGAQQIDASFDSLSVSWQVTTTHVEAKAIEQTELQGAYHYPLNIQGNKRVEVLNYIRHLKSVRKLYKRRYVE